MYVCMYVCIYHQVAQFQERAIELEQQIEQLAAEADALKHNVRDRDEQIRALRVYHARAALVCL